MVLPRHTRFRVKDRPPRIKYLSRRHQEDCRRVYIEKRQSGELREELKEAAAKRTESGRPKRPAEELRSAFAIDWHTLWWLLREPLEKMSGRGKHSGAGAMNEKELWGFATMRTAILVPSDKWVAYLKELRSDADVKELQKYSLLDDKSIQPVIDAIKNTPEDSSLKGLDLTVGMAHSLFLPEQLEDHKIRRTSVLNPERMADIARRWARKFSLSIRMYGLPVMSGFADEPMDEEKFAANWSQVTPEELDTTGGLAPFMAFEVRKSNGSYCYVVYQCCNDSECDIVWFIDSEVADDQDGHAGVPNPMYAKLLCFQRNLIDKYIVAKVETPAATVKRVLFRPVSFGPFAAPKSRDGEIDPIVSTYINVMCLRALVMDEPYAFSPEKCRRILIVLVMDMLKKKTAFPEKFRKGLFVCPPRDVATEWARLLETVAPEQRSQFGWASQSVYEDGVINGVAAVTDAVNVWLDGCKAEVSDEEEDASDSGEQNLVVAEYVGETSGRKKTTDERSVVAEADTGNANDNDSDRENGDDNESHKSRSSTGEESDTPEDPNKSDNSRSGTGDDDEDGDVVNALPKRSFEKPERPGIGKGKISPAGSEVRAPTSPPTIKALAKRIEEVNERSEKREKKIEGFFKQLLEQNKKRSTPTRRSPSPDGPSRRKKRRQVFDEESDSDMDEGKDDAVDQDEDEDEDQDQSHDQEMESSDEDHSETDDESDDGKRSGKPKKTPNPKKAALSEAKEAAADHAMKMINVAETQRRIYEEYFAIILKEKYRLTDFPEAERQLDVDDYVGRFHDNKRKRGIPEGLVVRDMIPDVALSRLRGRTYGAEQLMTKKPVILDRTHEGNMDVATTWSEFCMLADKFVPPKLRVEFFNVAVESWRNWTYEAPLRNRKAGKTGGFSGAIAYCGWCTVAYKNSQKHGTAKWDFSSELEPHFIPTRLIPGIFYFVKKGDSPSYICEKVAHIRVLLEKIVTQRKKDKNVRYTDVQTAGLWQTYWAAQPEPRPFEFTNTWRVGRAPEFLREDCKKKDDKDKDQDDDKDKDRDNGKRPNSKSRKNGSSGADGRKRDSDGSRGSTGTTAGTSGCQKKRTSSPHKHKAPVVDLEDSDSDKSDVRPRRSVKQEKLEKELKDAYTPKRAAAEPTLGIHESSGEDNNSNSPVLGAPPSHSEVLALIQANRLKREEDERKAQEQKDREYDQKLKERKKDQERREAEMLAKASKEELQKIREMNAINVRAERDRKEKAAKESADKQRRSESKEKEKEKARQNEKDKSKEKGTPKPKDTTKEKDRRDRDKSEHKSSRRSGTPDTKRTHKPERRSGAVSPTKKERSGTSSSHHASGDKKSVSRSEPRSHKNLY